MKSNFKSLKFKLVVSIVFILVIVTVALTTILIGQAQDRLVDEAKKNGMNLVSEISEKLSFSHSYQVIIEDMLSERVETVSYLVGQKEILSDAYLVNLSETLNITEINMVDENRKIIYSNMAANIGYIYPTDHALAPVFNGQKQTISEDVRQSAVDGKEYKYGGARADNGFVVQVGIEAAIIQQIKEESNYQKVLENSALGEEVGYALVIDLDSQAIAHSISDRVGLDLSDDEGVKAVLETQKPFSSEFDWDYEGEIMHIYDCLIPLVIDGEFVGIVNAGISLEQLDQDVQKMLFDAIIVAVISIILSAVFIFVFIGIMLKPLKQLKIIANEAAKGNLNQTISIKSQDEIGDMARSFNEMILSLRTMIHQINNITGNVFESTTILVDTTTQVTEVTNQIAMATQEVAQGAENQVMAINEASDNVRNVIENVNLVQEETMRVNEESSQNDATVKAAESKVVQMSTQMEKIRESVEGASTSMKELGAITESIGDIVDIINSIADQTNLLALNASIEAARAGEHGRGFAVVAEEIRKLAEESRNSTENIKSLIEQTQGSSNQALEAISIGNNEARMGGTLLSEVAEAFKGIEEGVAITRNSMESLKSRTDLINTSIENIYSLIGRVEETSELSASNSEEVAASTEEQSASVEEITATIEGLEEMMKQLKDSVEQFKVE